MSRLLDDEDAGTGALTAFEWWPGLHWIQGTIHQHSYPCNICELSSFENLAID